MSKIIITIAFWVIFLCTLPSFVYSQELGDVDNSGTIDIVDALLVAQEYVGLEPLGFHPEAADVNCDNYIDIVDALLIAQYYVYLIVEFPCPTITSPEITIYSPRNGSVTFNPDLELRGIVETTSEILEAYISINGEGPIPLVIEPDGEFNLIIPLNTTGTNPVGVENNIDIVVTDVAGFQDTESLILYLSYEYEQGVVVVTLEDEALFDILLQKINAMGALIRDQLPEYNSFLIELPPGMSTLEGIDLFNNIPPQTPLAEPNYFGEFDQVIPNDPGYTNQISLQTPQVQNAWAITTGSRNIVVALVDSGCDYLHPDLVNNLWVNQGELPQGLIAQGDFDGDGFITLNDANSPGAAQLYMQFGIRDGNTNGYIDGADLLAISNGIDDDMNGFVDDLLGFSFSNIPQIQQFPNNNPMDIVSPVNQGHGTAVVGTIAAVGNNNQGIAGLNFQSRFMILRVSNNFTGMFDTWAISRAMAYATTQGVQVANNSFSLYTPVIPAVWLQVYTAANNLGMLIACSAGNRGLDLDTSRNQWPGGLNATLKGTIRVEGYNANTNLARLPGDNYNTNFGMTTVDIAAPGTTTLVFSTRVSNVQTNFGGLNQGDYGVFFGTSAAAPHVAGTAALFLSAYPQFTGSVVSKLIITSSSPGDFGTTSPILNPLGPFNAVQPILTPRNIVTVPGANPTVNAEAKVFNQQLAQQANFYPFGFPVTGGVEVACGDIDNDGTTDLVFATCSGWTPPEVRVTDLQGTVIAQMNVAAPAGIYTMAAADLSGNGADEILLLLPVTFPDNTTRNVICAFEYRGSGQLMQMGYSQLGFPASSTLAAGDVDGDGVDEIAVGLPVVGTTQAMVNVYDITYGPGFPLTQISMCPAGVPVQATALEVAVADLEGDGTSEVIAVPFHGTGTTAKVYSINGPVATLITTFGWFSANPNLGSKPRLDAGDYDNDGVDELFYGTETPFVQIFDWQPSLVPGRAPQNRGFQPYGASQNTPIRVAVVE